MKPDIVVIAAHPDDLEIGAAGTIFKLRSLEFEVHIFILTSEVNSDIREKRKTEAIRSAAILGVSEENVTFLDMRDGYLVGNGGSVRKVKALLRTKGINPRIAITHSEHDSHNDHRAAREIALGALRNSLILHFGVVNSLIRPGFSPEMFVDISEFRDRKVEALKCHSSQNDINRLQWQNMALFEKTMAQSIETKFAEAFELTIQEGAQDILPFVGMVDCSQFGRFWRQLITSREIYCLFSAPRLRGASQWLEPATSPARSALSRLRDAFSKNSMANYSIHEHSSEEPGIDLLFYRSNVLLEGGPVSNRIAQMYFNHIPQLRFLIDYDMPGVRNIRIIDRWKKTEHFAKYGNERVDGIRETIEDLSILTIIRNPFSADNVIVGCMGIHAWGTGACINSLTQVAILSELSKRVKLPIVPPFLGYQVLMHTYCRTDELQVDWATWTELDAATSTREK
ncbi:MAG: Uncharacterized protein H6R18_295 [Proteobacteria bacterium]|nr:Uncharacterized protein [Pseudomonadota bacterium]